MSATRTAKVVVAGFGSEYRRDDGAGPAVADRVAELFDGVANLGPIADPLDLLGLWDGAELAVVIDAVHSGAEPGTVQLIEVGTAPEGESGGDPAGTTSTHGIAISNGSQPRPAAPGHMSPSVPPSAQCILRTG